MKNSKVIDIKSRNFEVGDIKSRNFEVRDVKSSMVMPSIEETIYRDPNVLESGMPIGLLLTLTYPENIGTVYPIRD